MNEYNVTKYGLFSFMYIVIVFTYIYIEYEYYMINEKHNLQNYLFMIIFTIFSGFAIYDLYKNTDFYKIPNENKFN